MAASDHGVRKKKRPSFLFFTLLRLAKGLEKGSVFASFFEKWLGPGMACVFHYILVDIYNFGLGLFRLAGPRSFVGGWMG